MSSSSKTVLFKIKRQARPSAPARWEEFEIRYRPNMNIVIALMDIERNPVTRDAKRTTPVVWEQNCLEEVCGACTMVINGRVRQACSTLVDKLSRPISVEPMTKFPVVRDLKVDRSRMFEALKRVRGWIPIDGTYHLGEGPRLSSEEQEDAYIYSRCMACGCCLEVCPQINPRSHFVGAAAIAQVRLFNTHPTGSMHKRERLQGLMGKGGIQDCGDSQNCVQACPKGIPLTTAIAEINRETVKEGFRLMFEE